MDLSVAFSSNYMCRSYSQAAMSAASVCLQYASIIKRLRIPPKAI